MATKKQTDKASDKKALAAEKQKKNKPAKDKSKKEPGVFARFGQYLKDVKVELRRVVWPTKQEVGQYTLVVVSTLIFFGVFIYIIDSLVIPMFVAFSGLR